MDVQKNLEVNVDKRTGNIYGPPLGTNLVVFIDDMNMPKVDTYGTAATHHFTLNTHLDVGLHL